MKSISKVLSLFLVVVMCFGLFSTSAYATAMVSFDFSGGNNAAENTNTAGGGFDFNPVGSSGSQSNSNGGFDFGGQQTQPASVEPQQQATNNGPTLSTQDTPMLGTPYKPDSGWTFHSTPTEITKDMSASDVEITVNTATIANGFDSDSFDLGFGYSTKSNGENMVALKQGEDYSITKNKLTIYGSFVKTLPVGTYYFFGLSTTSTPTQIAYLTVNSGNFGTFNIGGSPYNKNAVSPAEVFADSTSNKMGAFYGFGVVGVTDASFTKQLTLNTDYTSDSRYVHLKTSFLNTLADGTYKLIGFTTPTDINKDQVVIGSFVVESGALGVSYTLYGSPYDKSDPNAYISAEADGPVSETWLYNFVYTVVNVNGTYSHSLTAGEYAIGHWDTTTGSNDAVGLSAGYLNSLPDGKYTLIGTATVGSGTVDTTIGSFTIVTGGVDFGSFTVGNSPYDKSKSDRAAIVAMATGTAEGAKAAVNNVTGVAISGPESRTLTSSEYYKRNDTAGRFIAIRPEVLDTLPDGTYDLILTSTSGGVSAQRTVGHFIVTSGDLGEFTIANSPYDKNKDDRKLVAAVAKATGVVENVTGVAITGPENRTLTNSEYYKQADVKKTPGWVSIQKDVLDKLPDGTYNFLVTVTSGAASVQKNVGQFTITSGDIDIGEFVIKGSPYDKDADHDDPAAVSATAKTKGMIGKLSNFGISGAGSINAPRILQIGEYYIDTANDVFAIDNKVLDSLDNGTYYIVATVTVGISSKQVTLGSFNITSGGIDYGFQIHYSPYDKNKADHTAIVATANNKEGSKAKGIMARMSSFAIATGGTFSTGTYSNIQTLSPSEYTIDSANNGITIHNSVLDALADGNYVLLGSLTTGNVTQQLTIGGFTIISGDVKFGTTFIYETIYDKNDKDRKAVYGGVKDDFDARLKLNDFEITGVSDSTFSQALSVNQYTYTDGTTEKKIELSKDVLDTLPDGVYNLMCTATIGNVSKSISLGSFTVKSGNVNYGTPHIGNPLFDKNDEKRQIVYAWVTDADERFEMGSFVISGVTYPSINQTLSGSQYSMEGKTKVNISMDVLDALPDGDYNLLCTAKVGNAKIQMTLGMFTVVSGKIDYGTYVIYGSPYDKNADHTGSPFYAQATAADKMTKMTGFAITGITDPTFNRVLTGSEYARDEWYVTIVDSVLQSLPDGDYNLIGFATVLKNSAQVNMGKFSVVSNYGNFEVFNSPYDKNDKHAQTVFVTAEKKADMQKMTGFGVAAVNGSYVQALSVNNYYRSGDGYSVVLEESYLDTLADGQYYLIGFPTYGSTTEQVILGTFIVKSGGITGNAMLTPDGQVWYSGSDPLTFYSEIHDLAGKGWNYKPYDWGNIVPDVRYSTYSDMRSPTSVRIDQYWDLNYGYIMLGANFLNSLSAEHTYYLQVVDARDPEGLYSNVVSFRVGPTLRALDTDKHVLNSTRSLRFRSSEPISRVYVGNIELTDPADYGVSWDGRTVTLSFEFLNKRSGGNTYTIKVLTTSGEYASTTFQILTTAQGSASPRTGDESNLGLWAAFLLLSGTAVVILLPKLKKQNF